MLQAGARLRIRPKLDKRHPSHRQGEERCAPKLHSVLPRNQRSSAFRQRDFEFQLPFTSLGGEGNGVADFVLF